MSFTRMTLVFLTLLIPAAAFSQLDLSQLDKRHEKSVATEQGATYQREAVRTFWGDASFMKECAPQGATESLMIYFEVKPDGHMGEMVISPDTKVAQCIRQRVSDRQFQKPPDDVVVKIQLQFKK